MVLDFWLRSNSKWLVVMTKLIQLVSGLSILTLAESWILLIQKGNTESSLFWEALLFTNFLLLFSQFSRSVDSVHVDSLICRNTCCAIRGLFPAIFGSLEAIWKLSAVFWETTHANLKLFTACIPEQVSYSSH